MKHLLATALFATVALLGVAQDSQANGGLFRRSRGCEAPCAEAPCGPAVVASAPIQFEDRKVTRYKQVFTEREIDVVECQRVMRQEKYTYTVSVPVVTQEKRRVVVCEPTYRDEEYSYTVCVPVTTQEKRKVVVAENVFREVDHVWTEMVRSTVQKKVKVTHFDCIRENVVENVPVCRTVCVNYIDECGRCQTRRERVTVMEQQTRCVVRRVPVEREVVVNEVVCTPVERKGKRTVCEVVRTEKEVLVNVCRMDHQVKKGIRKVCDMVRVEKDVLVSVCNMQQQQREGVRTVCDVVHNKVKRKVQVCETVAYEEVVRVQVGGHHCVDSHDGCDQRGGRHHRGGGGLFRRGGGCCH